MRIWSIPSSHSSKSWVACRSVKNNSKRLISRLELTYAPIRHFAWSINTHFCCIVILCALKKAANCNMMVFNSQLGKALQAGDLDVPLPALLPSAPELGNVPYVFVADEAFPMKPYLLRPYPGRHHQEDMRVFNYRLSRARRIVENCFDILMQRWRVYCRRLQVCPDAVDSIVKATCIYSNLSAFC